MATQLSLALAIEPQTETVTVTVTPPTEAPYVGSCYTSECYDQHTETCTRYGYKISLDLAKRQRLCDFEEETEEKKEEERKEGTKYEYCTKS